MLERLKSLIRLLFVWKVHYPKGTASQKADCIIMLAFGQELHLSSGRILPGPANEAIGLAVANHYGASPMPPVIAQWEYSETQFGRNGILNIVQAIGSYRNCYLNTREVLQAAQATMHNHDYRNAIIVAQPWHLLRCIWTAKKLSIEVVPSPALNQNLNLLGTVWNEHVIVPRNQEQTTSLLDWLWYEFRARVYFWLKGWI